MSNELLWNQIHTEREALATDLDALTPQQWATPSLCDDWNVQQLVAHLVSTATSTKGGFFKGMVKFRGNFTQMINAAVTAYSSGSPEATLAAYKETMLNRTAPPGPVASWLGEAVIHGEDIRRPLGIHRDYPVETLRTVADFYKNSNLIIGAKKRIAGLKLVATDVEWSHGEGEVVAGPLLSLIMAMTGREAFLDDLSGDGVATLRTRFAQ